VIQWILIFGANGGVDSFSKGRKYSDFMLSILFAWFPEFHAGIKDYFTFNMFPT